MKIRYKPFWAFLLLVGAATIYYYVVELKPTGKPQVNLRFAPRTEGASTRLSAEDEKMLKDLMDSGIVENVNANMNEATVDSASWVRMKFDAKKHLGWFLATYCGKKKGTGLNWVDILDSYSGKKLAKYSETFGFKVY